MAHVRDRPSLAENVEITAPSGRRYRWASDAHQSADRPSGERWSDTMPGGFETHDATLPREPGMDYSDLERLSTITRYDACGGVIWQGRLERAPRVSGDQIAITPSAVGWQAHLEDNKSVRGIYVDRDLSQWQPPGRTWKAALLASSYNLADPSIDTDTVSNLPALNLSTVDTWASPQKPYCAAVYDAGEGLQIASVYYDIAVATNLLNTLILGSAINDDTASAETTANLFAGNTAGTFTPTTARRVMRWELLHSATPGGTAGTLFVYWIRRLAVFGNNGLTKRGTAPDDGFYDADIIRHAISRWCPLLSVTDESIAADSFIIPHSAFRDPTTVGEIVRQTTRFRLRDWAVWDGPTFWLHDRGARGRSWRARVGPTQLEETGPQVDRLWESIIVQYRDVDGSTRTVGPPGSGADTESSDLKDDDPENPANKLGIIRRDLLTMGISTAAGAVEVGARFLEQAKLLDSSGRARVVGHVQDDRGVWHPYSHIHAGDTVVFVDASDTSVRRVVRTDKTRDDRSCTIDLDAPPEGLQSLLERLGVVLVPLGL